jgi:hypothetical protein
MDVQKVAFAPSSALFATPSNSSKTKSVFETGLLLGAVVSCRSLRRSTESPNVPYPMPNGNSHYIFMSFANGCADPFSMEQRSDRGVRITGTCDCFRPKRLLLSGWKLVLSHLDVPS